MIEMNLQRHAATFIVLALFAMTMMPMVAQNLNTSNLTSSPYNRYGYGRLGSMGNTVTRSMGDVGIAIRSNQYTILANPASLTAIDTLSMLSMECIPKMAHVRISGMLVSVICHSKCHFGGILRCRFPSLPIAW